ncbi:hypothetical protein ES288_D09G027000v1 [Gossypium darwinii]|uniref:Uncharacterized protein n=2 Tax=Gossypium TaxID=3633 RepID=A0A5D2JBV7_GOSTO|nr:hypothetical protein ES288_D09G027000v1 [Gossypium darwinii]TYH52397.1 hypothetical protein ES332_D09G025200v1 [Gossypium tomentosum]
MVMATIDLMPLTLDLSEIGLNDDSKVFVFFVLSFVTNCYCTSRKDFSTATLYFQLNDISFHIDGKIIAPNKPSAWECKRNCHHQ